MILNTSILNGALEIMPHTLATMAIVPLQMRMVYQIGKCYGYELDRGHVKDFLATVGIGLTSQVFEGFTRRLVGGLARGLAGGLLGGLAGQAAGDQRLPLLRPMLSGRSQSNTTPAAALSRRSN